MNTMNVGKENSPGHCPVHGHFDLDYCCLDPQCSSATRCCVICLKNFHASCSNDFIIAASDVGHKICYAEAKPGSKTVDRQFEKHFESSLDLFIDKVVLSLQDKERSIAGDLESAFFQPNFLLDTSNWRSLRGSLNIKADEKQGKVTIAPKVLPDAAKLMAFLSSFEAKLDSFLNELCLNFSQVKLIVPRPLTSNHLWHHGDIFVNEEDSDALSIGCSGIEEGSIPRLAVLNQPFTQGMFEITIVDLGEDQILRIGVMDTEALDEVKPRFFEGLPSQGTFCFYDGLSKSENLKKKQSDAKENLPGFSPGDVVYVKIQEKAVAFYSKNRTTFLEGEFARKKKYLYFALTNEKVSFRLRYLN